MGIVSGIKERLAEAKESRTYERESRKLAQKEYLAEKRKVTQEYAKKKAKVEAEQKLKAFKARYSQSKPRGSMLQALMAEASAGSSHLLGGANPFQQPAMATKRPKLVKRKKKRKKTAKKPKRKEVYYF